MNLNSTPLPSYCNYFIKPRAQVKCILFLLAINQYKDDLKVKIDYILQDMLSFCCPELLTVRNS